MAREVKQVTFTKAAIPKLTRVAAYARVSSAKNAMHHSLSAQVSYYSGLIQNHPGWQYIGVYADEAKTGTKDTREGFVKLVSDCKAGKVDMVITKSISRFARNTVTLLETVRDLKALGIDVFFEEQSIHTLSADGELMLSILASYAQEGSLSASENQKWRVRKNFEEGKPWNGTLLGYRYRNGVYVIEPDEAETVRRIFREYLSGKGIVSIANDLNADGVRTRYENAWSKGGVSRILHNYAYSGNLLLQKTFRENHLTKKTVVNEGQLPMYYAGGHYQLGGLSSGTGRNCKEGQEIRSCREVLYRQIPILQPDRVRSLRQALPAKNYCHRSGVDLQHLQLSGPCRLSLQADTGAYADGHDRRFGYWRFNGNHSRGREHAGITLQRR